MLVRAACVGALASAPAAASGQLLSASRDWAALRFDGQCEARSRALRVRRGQPPAIAGFSFAAEPRRHGQFYMRLSRSPRLGASAILTVGDQPYLLSVRGQWAWARDPRQAAAIMAALRYSGSMRVESRDGAGRRFADRYSLGGAATAIDAAAAACAVTGKSR